MTKTWFRDEDGTFYRNCPLILGEMEATPWWRRSRFLNLCAEMQTGRRNGVIRKDKLGQGDREVQPRPFRETYPQHPILWQLDR